MNLPGNAYPLSKSGLSRACTILGVDATTIMALVNVETSGCGFLSDKRPIILFERHIFHRLTEGKYDSNSDISSTTPGGYGAGGSHQYDRLESAISCDKQAALKSTSWGLAQIMGFNAEKIGYLSIDDMVEDFANSEDNQLQGLVLYCLKFNLADELQRQDWIGFARAYNGPDFHRNNYDIRLASEYAKLKSSSVDLDVRSQQVELYFHEYLTITDIDGVMGPKTKRALELLKNNDYITVKRSTLKALVDQMDELLE